MSGNTLLGPRLVLMQAVHLVKTLGGPGPYEVVIVIELPFTLSHVTMALQAFSDEILQPAVEIALKGKQPIGASVWKPDKRDDEMIDGPGYSARMRLYYDTFQDQQVARIDVRIGPDE